ncbi:MAG: GNAT family N-acetyltransferase [Lachnospiraceae bacterium]|nr:GNAT family N-acetyltransferase [Lachnospiraceae bacterium]
MENTPALETERLVLRQFTENDIEALFRIFSDEEVNTFLPLFPFKTMEDAKAYYYEKYVKAYSMPRGYEYAICLKSDHIPIGYIHASMEENHDLGYGLCREFWHKGIVTEAGKRLIEKVKEDGFPYVTATHDVNNPRSGEVMKRLGMRYKYSYEEQWQPKDVLVTFRMYQLNLDGKQDRVYREYWDKYTVHYIENNI